MPGFDAELAYFRYRLFGQLTGSRPLSARAIETEVRALDRFL